ncbi:MAG TPA: hypothetical protein VGK32_08650 [Vicinamibacterales bacterium]|jgi:hypothetical protein
MLTQLVYLDEEALDQYVGAIEGGLISSATSRVSVSGSAEAGLDLKVVGGKGARARENEDERVVQDTPAARFARLLAAAAANPDALGWLDIMDADADLAGIGIGAMVSWECDVYVPDVVRMLARAGGALDALRMMRGLLPNAHAFGLDTSGLPADAEMGAMAGLLESMQVETLVAGEDEATDWRVAGQLRRAPNLDRLEGRARVVGKVTRVLSEGQWKPFLTFPGMSILPRAQRRALERQAPPPEKEDEYLHGPALMLEILAIYR